ncbi:four-carbon acid sugar kinase family protein [Actinopolymorpha sp. B11F2]|uniref:four-carbon acid sugar kinase family protein n=1 Tax=Actinopolymorpha sp. B11F2 TaxID=3160862 RepID=UPI0032E4604E
MADHLIAAFYGDDFTGASDALGQFHRCGLRTVLLFDIPDASKVRGLADNYDVIGIAGVARSLPTKRMDAEIGPALEALSAASPRVVQYKMCSTADSSSQVGSLGRAVEVGRTIFGARPVPVLAAQPELGRYTVFGHHFAVEDGVVHRLDRQPTMSHHPTTPMTESDLRIHVQHQTSLPVVGVDVTAYELPSEQALARYRQLVDQKPGVIIFDAVTKHHLSQAADLMISTAGVDPLYALGSGGLSYALGCQLSTRHPPDQADPTGLTDEAATLAVSGSCSGMTGTQISHAVARGWQEIRIEVDSARGADTSRPALRRLRDRLLAALRPGRGVVVYARAPTPRPAVDGVSRAVDQLASIGTVLGHAVQEAVAHAGVRRIISAGGDTSGRVMRQIDAQAAEVQHILGPGAVLCRLQSPDPMINGMTILLKGGQIGPPDLFERVRTGAAVRDMTEDVRLAWTWKKSVMTQ